MSKKKESKKELKTVTNYTASSQKTPIEIMLKIDDNGMTTASNLYTFLELDPSHFSRWCTKNIKNNKFATENIDYILFAFDGENSHFIGRPKTDYKLTSDFAKKLSMTGNSERHEQARQYFLACEQGLKIAAKKLQSNNVQILATLENITTLLSDTIDRITCLESAQQETLQLQTTKYKKPFNPWFFKMQPKYNLLQEYFNISRGQLYKHIIYELENIYHLDTQQIQADYCYENNVDSCYPLDPYEFIPKYRDMIEQIVNANLIKYGIADETDPITSTRHITIFDTPVKSAANSH